LGANLSSGRSDPSRDAKGRHRRKPPETSALGRATCEIVGGGPILSVIAAVSDRRFARINRQGTHAGSTGARRGGRGGGRPRWGVRDGRGIAGTAGRRLLGRLLRRITRCSKIRGGQARFARKTIDQLVRARAGPGVLGIGRPMFEAPRIVGPGAPQAGRVSSRASLLRRDCCGGSGRDLDQTKTTRGGRRPVSAALARGGGADRERQRGCGDRTERGVAGGPDCRARKREKAGTGAAGSLDDGGRTEPCSREQIRGFVRDAWVGLLAGGCAARTADRVAGARRFFSAKGA